MKKIISTALILILCITAIFVFCSCSKSEEINTSRITSVEIKGKGDNRRVKIEAEFTDELVEQYKGQKVYLVALNGADPDNESATHTPIEQTKLKNKVKFEVPYQDGGKTHLNTAFVCAIVEGEGDNRQLIPITEEQYISNVSELGSSAPRPSASSIKGLATDDIGQAMYLGTSHILLEVKINDILLSEYKDGAISFVSEGKTYFFDADELSYYDEKIKEATDANIRVYLQFLLELPEKNDKGKYEKDIIECLYFSSYSKDAKAYMINLSDKQAAGYARALFDLFASRYSGGEYGSAVDYIIGKNVNNQSTWNNAGKTDAADVEKYYNSLVRMAYNSLTSKASNGQVYISLDNNWRASSGGALAFLNSFNTMANAGGSYDWGIALSYGNMSGDTAWAGTSEYSDKLSADSIFELSGILKTSEFLYKSEQRSAIISEFSINENSESASSASRRASSYAYVYYSTVRSGCIDALIYSSFVNDTTGLIKTDGKTTPIYNAFAVCSSNSHDELDALGSLIGKKWDALKDEDIFDDVSIYYGVPTDKEIKTSNGKKLFNFSNGVLYGFEAIGSSGYIALKEYADVNGDLSTALYADTGEYGFGGYFCRSVGKSEISSSKYIGVTLNSEYSGREFVLIISGTDKKTNQRISYCATAQASSQPTEYFFDISDFSDRLSKSSDVSISICSTNRTSQPSEELALYKIALYGSSGSQVWKYILIAVGIIATALILFVLIKIFEKKQKKSRKKKPSKKKPSKKKSQHKSGSKKSKLKKRSSENFDDYDDDTDDTDDTNPTPVWEDEAEIYTDEISDDEDFELDDEDSENEDEDDEDYV